MKLRLLGHALLLTLLSAMIPLPVMAQLSFQGKISAMIDDNVNNNSLRLSDRITSLGLQVGHDWETELTNTQLFATTALNYHTFVPGRTFQYHMAGLAYSRLWGDDEETLLNAGATVGFRSDREEYLFYDHRMISLYANLKHAFSGGMLGRAGYTLRTLQFSELPAFNYTEHVLFAQSSFFLPSRTTIILQTDIGAKLYGTANEDSVSATQGNGRGRSGESVSAPGVIQAIGSIRIGQSLTEGTGLSVTAGYQANLLKEARVLGSEFGMMSDDDLFDDHYGYEGPQAGLMVTQLLPWDMKLRINGSWQERQYATQAAYDLEGILVDPHRFDVRRAVGLHLTVPLTPLGCTVEAAYDHISNRSNDPFFTYTNNAFVIQISYP